MNNKNFNTYYDVIHNASINELPDILINMVWELCEDGMVTEEELFAWLNSKPEQTTSIPDIETIEKYFKDNINLNDYDLGGCEFCDEDFEVIQMRMEEYGETIDDAICKYLFTVRDVLDTGLEE